MRVPHRLSPEARILVAATGSSGPGGAAETLAFDRVSRERALHLGWSNGVAGFVSRFFLERSSSVPADADQQRKQRAHAYMALLRQASALDQLGAIGAHLAAENLHAMVYKGVDFQKRWYEPDCPRTFRDLDLVVRTQDVDGAHRALGRAGYRLAPRALPIRYYRRFHLHAIYHHPRFRLPLELHWAFDSPFSRSPCPVEPVIEAAEAVPEYGPNLLRPASMDALILMAFHLDKHLGLCATCPTRELRLHWTIGSGGLRWVLDVVRWMKQCGDSVVAENLVRRARGLGVERSLVIALRLADDLDSSALPGWARAIAGRLPGRKPLLCRLLYPNTRPAHGSTGIGAWTRKVVSRRLPIMAFRPIRVIETIMPRFDVPGVAPAQDCSRLHWALRVAHLSCANLSALIALRARRMWGERE